MADLDIDSLLQDLDDAVDTSPQHSKQNKHQGVPQENLHPQNVVPKNGAYNDDVSFSKNDNSTLDDSTLDKLLSIMPVDVDDSNFKALAPHSPVCPLKRRPLKESKLHTINTSTNAAHSSPGDDNIDSILSSANDAIGADDSPILRHPSPRPPPPRKRSGSTPQPAGTPSATDDPISGTSDPFDAAIIENQQHITPPASPIPVHSRPNTVEYPAEVAEEIAGEAEVTAQAQGQGQGQEAPQETVDIGCDFDEHDPTSPARVMTPAASRPNSAASPGSISMSAAMAACVADGTIPDIDTEGLTREIDNMLGQTSASAPAEKLVSDGKVSFTALPQAPTSTSVGDQKKLRCIKSCISGPSLSRGHKQSSFSRDICCGNLRCIKCNFSVRTYSNAAWDSTVDYMFLRNAFPEDAKLSTKLVVVADGCAYCCQCSWVVATAEQDTKDLGLSWNCSGHAAGASS